MVGVSRSETRPLFPGHMGMTTTLKPESPELLKKMHLLFRDYFDRAERKRRWSLRDGIPWDQCNRSLNPAIADVVETFCTVELYLPDYLSKLIPQVRANKGRAWMLANWGYEESKHSMALGDWLLRSGMRSDEQMTDLESEVFSHEWNLPHDNGRGMICYVVLQELATWLHYYNLRERLAAEGGDGALHQVLTLISIDERAHYDFFRRLLMLYLEEDREGTLEQLRIVVNTFDMPAVHMMADSHRRREAVKKLRIFDYDIYYFQVFEPVVKALGVTRAELRRKTRREVMPPASAAV
jgi:acyl-[acyl-carrier-protein] desaturase